MNLLRNPERSRMVAVVVLPMRKRTAMISMYVTSSTFTVGLHQRAGRSLAAEGV